MIDLKYRPEVDGLRAVAVGLVLLFHADLGFSGGFIGVDVFFVISGFLITGLILKRDREDGFQLSQFWVRRIRRILPASIVTTAITLIVGGFLLMPDEYQNLGESAFSQQLMVSNFYFWRNTGYFDAPANYQPLMHTWSLAVEEQFYLIFPFLLYVLCRFRTRIQLAVLIPLFLASFLTSEWTVRNAPSAAYFLLPSRAWEMLLGGLICYLPVPSVRFGKFHGLCSFVSLVTIVACGWWYHESQSFPGLTALLPVFAAALFIYSNSGQLTRSGRFIATRPIVFVGLISYSLYLVHWPILAFVRMEYGMQLSPSVGISCLIASFALAYLSWRFVEQPVRKQAIFKSTKSLVGASLCVPALLMFGAFSIYQTEGFPNRLPEEAQVYLAVKDTELNNPYRVFSNVEAIESRKVIAFGDLKSQKRVLVWGDSHAMAIMPGVDLACRDAGVKCYQITMPGNPPIFNFESPYKPLNKAAIPLNNAVKTFLQKERIQEVVLIAWWNFYAKSDPEKFEAALIETIQQIHQMGLAVTIIEDVAHLGFDPPSHSARTVWNNGDVESLGQPLKQHYFKNRFCRKVFKKLKKQGIRVYDPAGYFVDETNLFRAAIDHQCLYRDSHHLSLQGARRLKPMFEKILEESPVRVVRQNKNTLN